MQSYHSQRIQCQEENKGSLTICSSQAAPGSRDWKRWLVHWSRGSQSRCGLCDICPGSVHLQPRSPAHVRGEGVWGAWGGYSTGPRCKAGCQRDAEESEQLFCCDSHGRNDQKAGAGLLLFQAAAGNSVAVWDKVANFLCSSNFMFASWR